LIESFRSLQELGSANYADGNSETEATSQRGVTLDWQTHMTSAKLPCKASGQVQPMTWFILLDLKTNCTSIVTSDFNNKVQSLFTWVPIQNTYPRPAAS